MAECIRKQDLSATSFHPKLFQVLTNLDQYTSRAKAMSRVAQARSKLAIPTAVMAVETLLELGTKAFTSPGDDMPWWRRTGWDEFVWRLIWIAALGKFVHYTVRSVAGLIKVRSGLAEKSKAD